MKATLYSADFLKTPDGIKLLELNTDTSFLTNQIDEFDFTQIHAILSSSNADEVHVIYKSFQTYFVNAFSQSLHESSSITTFNKTEEGHHTIYPTDVADSDTKFILRCAYNESAIFDSEYCKEAIGLYKLMSNGTTDYSQSVIDFYYSSSEETQVYDYLRRGHINQNSIVPDYVTKNTLESEEGGRLKFYKLNATESGSYVDKANSFISSVNSDGKLILPYYDTTNGQNYVKSIRSANILFGPDLENINLYTGEVSAPLDIPTTESFQAPTGSESYKVYPQKHYYEFATNFFKFDWRNTAGIAPFEYLQSGSETIPVSDAVVGNNYKSIRIPGLPDTDSLGVLMSWSLEGNTLPAETTETSSLLVQKTTHENVWGVYNEIVFGTSSLLTGPSLPMLIYESSSNETKYEYVSNLDSSNHFIYKLDGTLQSIDELNFFVTNEPSSSTIELNFESDDTFIINEAGVKLVSHNIYYGPGAGFYCFVAGTQITLSDGSTKDIQDIVVNEQVLTYNEKTGENEVGDVGELKQHEVNSIIRITLDNENIIKTTSEHPFYVNGKGWVKAGELEVLDTCKKENGEESLISSVEVIEETVTVYNLLSVGDNHNFYANGILVHNK